MRILRKVQLDLTEELPGFVEETAHIRKDPSWRVSPVPVRLQCRHVDIGDLSPCDTQRLKQGLKSTAQGIQVIYTELKIPFPQIYVSVLLPKAFNILYLYTVF